MRFYFPDSQDLVSPAYDFIHDEYPPWRVRQRDDLYAHEVLESSPYHGLLVSKSIVDGSVRGAGKYTSAQRQRLYRMGVRAFFRLPDDIVTMGDNGAFNYVDETVPPVTVQETLDFYESCGFDAGVSVDHVILGYDDAATLENVDPAWSERRRITLRLAEEFMGAVTDRGGLVEPVGVAQGWSPASYADSVRQLQVMGYRRIALGGMVPLKTPQIMDCLQHIEAIRSTDTDLHLLGITRVTNIEAFAELGVTSFDSTSPFRQSFMDERRNYHTTDDAYVAIRVPQVDGNPALRRRVLAGTASQKDAIEGERACLATLRGYDEGTNSITDCLQALEAYEQITGTRKSYLPAYERTLAAAPWEACPCALCRQHGIEIAIFRGTERNKRRGFHNLTVLATRMRSLQTANT